MNMSGSSNIKNLDNLEKEIYRLKLKSRQLEDRFDSNLEHLQNNYGSMIRNSIFQSKKESQPVSSSILDSVVNNEKLQNALNRIVNHLAEKAADGIDAVIDKLFKKKD